MLLACSRNLINTFYLLLMLLLVFYLSPSADSSPVSYDGRIAVLSFLKSNFAFTLCLLCELISGLKESLVPEVSPFLPVFVFSDLNMDIGVMCSYLWLSSIFKL